MSLEPESEETYEITVHVNEYGPELGPAVGGKYTHDAVSHNATESWLIVVLPDGSQTGYPTHAIAGFETGPVPASEG